MCIRDSDKAGHTYEAYQIFAGDVSSDDPTDGATSGPILSNITWGNGVNGAAPVSYTHLGHYHGKVSGSDGGTNQLGYRIQAWL